MAYLSLEQAEMALDVGGKIVVPSAIPYRIHHPNYGGCVVDSLGYLQGILDAIDDAADDLRIIKQEAEDEPYLRVRDAISWELLKNTDVPMGVEKDFLDLSMEQIELLKSLANEKANSEPVATIIEHPELGNVQVSFDKYADNDFQNVLEDIDAHLEYLKSNPRIVSAWDPNGRPVYKVA